MSAHIPSPASLRRPFAALSGARLLARYSALKALTAIGALAAVIAATSVADAGARQNAPCGRGRSWRS